MNEKEGREGGGGNVNFLLLSLRTSFTVWMALSGPCLDIEGVMIPYSQTRGQWPHRVASDRALKMASDLKPATSITLESICILLLKATFMASEALVASK